MYKVFIIDDEQIIVDGLTRVIPWDKYGCTVAATANNVSEGIVKIKEAKPDILITDIKMPDGDGLTMLAGLRAEYPNMQVTVLTGYREFSYAQKAINLGVVRFLLKPSKIDELHQALEVMVEKLKVIGESKTETVSETVETAQNDSAASFIVRQAVQYIEEKCCEKITLVDVANACYISQWHLSKLLNKYTNQNFYDILNKARVEKAKKLMEDPSLRICDISDMVGYVDSPHFSRIFKKLEGISANEYRNLKI